jgi:hypothetical protein
MKELENGGAESRSSITNLAKMLGTGQFREFMKPEYENAMKPQGGTRYFVDCQSKNVLQP